MPEHSASPGGGLTQGVVAFATVLHEIGHTLGLPHTFDGHTGWTILAGVTEAHYDTGVVDLDRRCRGRPPDRQHRD